MQQNEVACQVVIIIMLRIDMNKLHFTRMIITHVDIIHLAC